MKTIGKSVIVSFIKGGQIVATSLLFLTFMGVLFHGKYVWVEPNIVILAFEIVLSASWLIGSILDLVQLLIHAKKSQLEKRE